jgi:hypothetical protein
MAAIDYRQDYTYSQFTPVDNTGKARNVFKSAYKNLRFVLQLQEIRALSEDEAANLPGLSFGQYGVVDFWRVLLQYNGLQDPIQDVYAGMQFMFPTKSSAISWMTQQQNSQTTTLTI